MASLSLLQGIFPTQGSNPGLPHCRRILYQLSHKGSPRILEGVTYPSSSGSSQPRSRTRVSCIAGGFFTSWATREALYLYIMESYCMYCSVTCPFLCFLGYYVTLIYLIELTLPSSFHGVWMYSLCNHSWFTELFLLLFSLSVVFYSLWLFLSCF